VAAITIKQAVATVLEDGSWLQRTNDSVQEFRKQNEKWTTVTAGMSYRSAMRSTSTNESLRCTRSPAQAVHMGGEVP
jgi:hypothetical protein